MKYLGSARLKGEKLRQYDADLQLHRNDPGTIQIGTGNHPLVLEEGLSLVPEGSIRLPLLGLRALIQNDLKLIIEGKKRRVTLQTKGWL